MPLASDTSVKRCGLYIGVITSALVLSGLIGGWFYGAASAAYAWKEVRELKDELHDKSAVEQDEILKGIAEYTERQLKANEALCAAGKLNRFWCRTQGLEWKTLVDEE